MHASLYVVSRYVKGASPEDISQAVGQYLEDTGFVYGDCTCGKQDDCDCNQNGYCDWFEIGGRWATNLFTLQLATKFGTEKADAYIHYASSCHDIQLWNKYTRPDRIPPSEYWRCLFGDDLPPVSYEEAAQQVSVPLTAELLKRLLDHEYLHGDIQAGGALLCPDGWHREDLAKQVERGDVWITVVDFHM